MYQLSRLCAGRLALCLTLIGAGLAQPAFAQAKSKAGSSLGPVAVLELFTSQGCSSCPPADRLFELYAKRTDVVALTMPVDYWDYLGWKDTLASPRYSQRQRQYAKSRGDGAVYTPQIVVNGKVHTVGSKQSEIDKTIQSLSKTAMIVKPVLRKVGDHLEIRIPDGPTSMGQGEFTVWFASVQTKADVGVRRGENRGEVLSYFNVVRNISAIGMWTGTAKTYQVPLHSVQHASAEKCAVLLQRGKGGPIVGAAWYGH
ncbi:MAG: DUF1223 domain-containing protein [Pseudomonadota bacterium]